MLLKMETLKILLIYKNMLREGRFRTRYHKTATGWLNCRQCLTLICLCRGLLVILIDITDLSIPLLAITEAYFCIGVGYLRAN